VRAAELASGRLLSGKYQLNERIATGGMGIVFAGVHLATGRKVAIKRLRPELSHQPELAQRVCAEAPFVVLERLSGDTLEAWLSKPLPLLPTVQVLLPIVNALVSLHQLGIVHRDIKPSNIFVHSDSAERVTPKLLDFGIAKALAEAGLTLTGVVLGTPAYMAPEQALGAAAVSPANDIWAIAVVFVRCLTGKLPFTREALQRVGLLRNGLSHQDLDGVPEPLALVLAKALHLEPSERHSSMDQFRELLLQALRSIDPSAAWPGESTSGYDRGSCTLPAACGVRSPQPQSDSEFGQDQSRGPDLLPPGFGPVIARDGVTRTLSSGASASAPGARRWIRWGGAFSTVGLAAAITLRLVAPDQPLPIAERAFGLHAPASRPPEDTRLASDVQFAPANLEPTRAAATAGAEQVVAPPGSLLAPIKDKPRNKLRQSRVRENTTRGATPSAIARTSADTAVAPTKDQDPVKSAALPAVHSNDRDATPRWGANRAPIIE
jgi:eukaryotic-like serine/threonine-protein kinase